MTDIVTLAKEGMEIIQTVQPGLETAAKTATSLTTIGSTVVRALQMGKKLYTFIIGSSGDDAAEKESETTISAKQDVAVLVDINRRMLRDVAGFLEAREIDANLIVVTNDRDYGKKPIFLNPEDPGEWEELVREFHDAIASIKQEVGGARCHIFLSTPLSLAFGLGSVWGTVDNATVYHWEENTYHPSMKISRKLRQ